jgi:5-methylcytosine-specific restriction protein B
MTVNEYDVTTKDGIKQVYEKEFLPLLQKDEWKDWLDTYVEIIEVVQSSSVDELASPEVQKQLWESTHICHAGMSSIPMKKAIASKELGQWIAELRDRELPASGERRIEELKLIHDELVERTKPFRKRTPWLKFMRLLAAIYPKDICCVVDYGKLRLVSKAMFGKAPAGRSSMVTNNAMVLQRIDEAIGVPKDDATSLAKRSMFAWEIYRVLAEENEEEDGEVEGERPGESMLKFLPVGRRYKGITAMTGYVDTALKVLDFVQNGVTVSETLEYFQQEQPQLKESSAKIHLNSIRHRLGLLKLEGNTLRPSALGQRLLDTEDPTILIPRVLTRVIGFDVLLYDLNEKSPRDKTEVYAALKEHYPNWTTDFAPSALLAWSHKLRMVEVDVQQISITEAGQEWAEQIPARPEPIAPDEDDEDDPVIVVDNKLAKAFSSPSLEEILDRFDKLPFVFPREIIARLHVALHMHPSKHFVLLSGLSGTGKTKLAELYANAYHRVDDTKQNRYFRLIPVQPDWTDPAGLLGYVNPLQETVTYAATDFLMFLKSAVATPKIPHFVCLDEMNLARVEYYFAPLLSAMETAQNIVIHQNDEPVDTIEPSLPWPSNLYIIGTVNMDETTHGFSDKVLDRAFTLEFWDVDLDAFSKRFAMSHSEYSADLLKFVIEKLKGLQAILEPAHLHFGYRTAEEVLTFLGTNDSHGAGVMDKEAALDQALLMKSLPKIRGQDSPEFRTCLDKLHSFLKSNSCPDSAQKVEAMKAELELTGTTRFWR